MAVVKLFATERPLNGVFEQRHRLIAQGVERESEDYVRGVDLAAWAAHLADAQRLDPPVLLSDEPALEDLGPVQVDATGMGGISFTSMEWGRPLIRAGRRMRATVPVQGDVELLGNWPGGGTAVIEGEIETGAVTRTWEWPVELGAERLEQEVREFYGALQNGAQRVASDVRRFNGELPAFTEAQVAKRRTAVERQEGFLDALSIPVKRRADAPQTFALPPIKPRPRPAATAKIPRPEPLPAVALDQLYDHILQNVRAMGHAMERTPRDFATRDEERLRDHLLVILNTHYEGQVGAETFNKSGKTDVLIRVQDRVAFIGECKWWSGVKDMSRALEQLYGYATWRDSGLALIFFVGQRDVTALVAKAREAMAVRDEFLGWESGSGDRELRCRIRWPDDPERRAALTILFFHLPKDG
jgi:hypothetical protein